MEEETEQQHPRTEAPEYHGRKSLSSSLLLLRPRFLYTTIFAWIAITGGRFLAPFLEHEARLSSTEIGTLLAIQTLVGVPIGSIAGAYADALEFQYPGKGRARVMAMGVLTGSGIFLLHATWRIGTLLNSSLDSNNSNNNNNNNNKMETESFFQSLPWFFVLRVLYAISYTLVFPVLDGMCLDFLDKELGCSTDDYGKERLWGAISWAVTNIVLAPSLDYFGFLLLYPLTIVSTVVVWITIQIFATERERMHLQRQLQKRKSTIQDQDQDQHPVSNDNVNDNLASHNVENNSSSTLAEEHGSTNLNALTTMTTSQDANNNNNNSNNNNKNKNRIPVWTVFRHMSSTSYGIAFLFFFLTIASGQAIVDNLVFLFFEFLGSSYVIMGWTVVLTVAFEIPIFHIAPKLLQRYGANILLQVAAACYVVRVIGYSLIPQGQIAWVLLLEPLHGITYASSATASVGFVTQFIPPGYEATGQGLLYFIRGAGSVLGLFFGGWLEEILGPRIMYRISATVVACGSVVFWMALIGFFHPSSSDDDDDRPGGNTPIVPIVKSGHKLLPQEEQIELTESMTTTTTTSSETSSFHTIDDV